jgi:hypothetical protein
VEKSRLEDEISRLVNSRKLLEADVSLKKIISLRKKRLSVGIENILLQFNISAAAYHGGKLNGIDCHEFV